MTKLEQLKQDFIDARAAYDRFMEVNAVRYSNPETEELSRQDVTFSSPIERVETSEKRIILDMNGMIELKKIQNKIVETQSLYMVEYRNQNQDNG